MCRVPNRGRHGKHSPHGRERAGVAIASRRVVCHPAHAERAAADWHAGVLLAKVRRTSRVGYAGHRVDDLTPRLELVADVLAADPPALPDALRAIREAEAIILDHAGNSLTHGLPDDDPRMIQLRAARAKANFGVTE